MLDETDLGAPRQDDDAVDDDFRLLEDAVDHLRGHGVVGGSRDAGPEHLVAGDVAIELAALQQPLHGSGEKVDEVLPALCRGVLRRLARQQPLEDLAYVVELVDLCQIEARDDGAAVRDPLDQAAALERAEDLADARARHAELLRQLLLLELGAGRNVLVGDARSQDLQHLDAARLAGNAGACSTGRRPAGAALARGHGHDLVRHRGSRSGRHGGAGATH